MNLSPSTATSKMQKRKLKLHRMFKLQSRLICNKRVNGTGFPLALQTGPLRWR